MLTARRASLIAIAALAATLLFALGAGPASAAKPKAKACPARSGTIARDRRGFGRVWHKGTSLYACTTVYGHAPKTERMGPYAAGTKVAFDGVNVTWTVPMVKGGKKTDRVWAANVDSGSRWMLAQKPNPAGTDAAARETRVQRIVVRDQAIAWVTKGGDVVGALRSPEDDPVTIGTLPAAPVVQKNLVLLGSFTGVPVMDLATSLQIEELDGDGDECGGVNPYRFTVRPDASTPAAGVEWTGGWTSTNCF
ncbi:MAG: hypothetical protein JWO02_1806 [Solirubrobacterales bacterium]|nr:hypothetical protein [Solirubrobacterales bacterium]